MKVSNSFIVTRREFPNDEIMDSTKLLIKSGMVLKLSNGFYTYLPLGLKVVENIKKIIKEEFMKINLNEIFMPTMLNNDIYKLTLRDKMYGNELYKIKDRNSNLLNLSACDEELFIDVAKNKIRSYKDLHFTLYQINNKYRDEEKTNYGIVRKKEFLTASACSFDADEGGLEVSYDKMFMTFKNIFNKFGIDTLVVESSPLTMNNVTGEEFQVISNYGDNRIVKCTNCSYACRIEDANSKSIYTNREIEYKKRKLVDTPDIKSIKEVSEYLDVFPSNILKSLICKIDNKYKLILLRGESELSINKLKKLFKTNSVEIPTSEEVSKMGTAVGYVGPIGCNMEIIADNEVKSMHNFICGSNKKNYHFMNVNIGRDFNVNKYADLKLFDENSLCPICKNKCEIVNGIEVGQLFKLGRTYSDVFNLTYTDELNYNEYVELGSYQIGIDRVLSAIVEKYHDDKGLMWPLSVSPFKVAIVVYNVNDKEIMKYAKILHDKLIENNIETILDDRKETLGVKLNDMELIGIPIMIVLGKRYIEEGLVEIKYRNNNTSEFIEKDKIVKHILSFIERNK